MPQYECLPGEKIKLCVVIFKHIIFYPPLERSSLKRRFQHGCDEPLHPLVSEQHISIYLCIFMVPRGCTFIILVIRTKFALEQQISMHICCPKRMDFFLLLPFSAAIKTKFPMSCVHEIFNSERPPSFN